MDPEQLGRVDAMVAARGGVARLTVMRHGRVVLDRGYGCDPDALFLLFSVSKPYLGLLIHLLVERGALRLDDPVAAHWPEYGKDAITVRHVLTHRAGVPYSSGTVWGDAAAMSTWDRAVTQAERARPRWAAGTVPAYHVLSYGFVLGELVRRVTGEPVAEVLRRELLEPLALRDTYLGLPAATLDRAVRLVGRGGAGEAGFAMLFNRRRVREAVIPAATVSTTGRDLATLYQALLDRSGPVTEPIVRAATEVSADNEMDRVIRAPMRWGHGFQLGAAAGADRPMGTKSAPETFGHNGSGACLAWADPTRSLVVVYLTNLITSGRRSMIQQCAISDAILHATA